MLLFCSSSILRESAKSLVCLFSPGFHSCLPSGPGALCIGKMRKFIPIFSFIFSFLRKTEANIFLRHLLLQIK